MTTDTDTRDLMAATAVGVGAIAAVLAIAVGYAIYTGAILWLMWGWFMVPLGVGPDHHCLGHRPNRDAWPVRPADQRPQAAGR